MSSNTQRITGYGVGAPSIKLNPPPIISTRDPTTNDTRFPLGQEWVNKSTASVFALGSVSAGVATWVALGGGSSAIATINSNAPIAGNYVLAGTANQIAVAQTAGTTTFTIPATLIAPGSIAATTTVTATLGNITATNGNFVASTAGSGLVLPVATASGATPQVANARVGSVTFTGVSIAAAATSTFVITNSTITGAGTVVLYSLRGATTGAAPTIQSVTNSAGSSSIVVTNGTGATTQTGNLTFDYIVLN